MLSAGSSSTLPRTGTNERKVASMTARKVKSLSMLLRRDPTTKKDVNAEIEGLTHVECLQRLIDFASSLFSGEGLQDTIETINRIIVRYKELCQDTHERVNMNEVTRSTVRQSLAAGLQGTKDRLLTVPDDKLLLRFVDSWAFFLSSVYPYLQGAFEPMTLTVEMNSTMMRKTTMGSLVPQSMEPQQVGDLILECYRKELVSPLLPRIDAAVQVAFLNPRPDRRFVDSFMRLIQMFAIMAALNRLDEDQRRIELLLASLKQHYMRIFRSVEG